MIALSDKTVPTILEDELQSSYLDYSMSVIVSRALPDVRDGLKPVHRRILYGMHDLGMQPNKPYKKSARIVGDVLGKYHPHGDSAVYDAMVRMAQEWSLRYPLVDGQGNFGSIDGDSPAAMRYTETRLDWLATEMLKDIDKNTVDFSPNFDESLEEPTVLPSVVPNLLINGASGIAVGMATNIPPHNLTEIVDGLLAMIKNENLTLEELAKIVTGPDFPTGGEIHGYAGIRDAYRDGRGKLIVRAVAKSDKAKSGKTAIIITELPYQVNKASLIEKIAELVRQKTLEDISDIRDESDRDGIRVVIELKRDAIAEVVLNNLYKHTQMQVTFGCNMLALVNGMPKTLGLLEMMRLFIEHRNVVIVRRSKYELDIAEKRAHILEGFLKALNHLDEVIKTIKESRDPKVASTNLQARFELSEEQAKAILEMRLQRLTGLEREKIHQEYKDILQTIERLNIILASKTEQMRLISDELTELKNKFGDARRTKILPEAKEIRLEDMIADEDVIITITHKGFIKRTPVSSYRNQNKGGRGSMGVGTYEDDFVEHVFRASTHHYLMFFTDKGRCYKVKVYDLPEGSRTAKGRSLANVIQKTNEENVTTYLPVKDFMDKYYIVMATKNGVIKKCELSDFANIRTTGIIAINLADNDELVRAKLTDGNCEILIGTRNGLACRFHEDDVRAMGRAAAGVRSISLRNDDYVVSLVSVLHVDSTIIVVGENGLGKRTAFKDFRLTRRGAKGVISMNITERTGKVVRLLSASDNEDLVVITTRGVLIRQPVMNIRVIGRNTQGVRLIRLDEGDSIADITSVLRDENGNGNGNGDNEEITETDIENQEKIDFSEADENSEN